jgi:uncharacterized protein (TIGR03437 family)
MGGHRQYPGSFARIVLTFFAMFGCAGGRAFAQSNFTGFTPGNLVVTRSVYAGDATTVMAGQSLPPICPVTASCGGIATGNGAFPTPGSTNNVWNNANVDGSFGITSPIFLDQITPNGAWLSTLAVPANLLVTSFNSKSELAVNLSQDGTALTLLGVIAPVNAIDVSDSNTPGVYDPTNPAGGSYFRAVAQIDASGAIQVTPTNSYSGSNGRAVILANGLYYMVGNSNNGSSTPANVVASTGVQAVTPGQAAGTPPLEVGNFSIAQVTDPSTGKPYAADKLGKDDNFRGLTIFNNTIYVTKGSGSNGVNTVYQVGTAGALPALANAANTPIAILPGFPTTPVKDSGVGEPFGIWFANATTIYVADEGDGTAADAATSQIAGLQKWSLANGAWQLDYVLQNGLNLGQQYSILDYPAALNPATDGLRNITGRVNGDGTVTIWAITSTISANGDTGADPNGLVMITDLLSNTSASAASSEQFVTLITANAGEVLRGVSFTPTSSGTLANSPLIISAANPGATAIAPGSLVFAFGQDLAVGTPGEILGVLPTTFAGTSVTIVDSTGNSSAAPLLFVSSAQVTFLVPAGVASGLAKVTVTTPAGSQAASNIQIGPVAPGLFTINNAGLASGYAVLVTATGAQTAQQIYSINAAGSVVANPINMGSSTDRVYLTLFGTGLQAAGAGTVQISIGGVAVPALYAGPQESFVGLDQVNLPLPVSLTGKGNVNIQVSAAGIASNPVQVTIQ